MSLSPFTIAMKMHFYGKRKCAVVIESDAVGKDRTVAEIFLFTFFLMNKLSSRAISPEGQLFIDKFKADCNTLDLIKYMDKLETRNNISLVKHEGRNGKPIFMASLIFDGERYQWNVDEKGFAIFKGLITEYENLAPYMLFIHLVKSYGDEISNIGAICEAARQSLTIIREADNFEKMMNVMRNWNKVAFDLASVATVIILASKGNDTDAITDQGSVESTSKGEIEYSEYATEIIGWSVNAAETMRTLCESKRLEQSRYDLSEDEWFRVCMVYIFLFIHLTNRGSHGLLGDTEARFNALVGLLEYSVTRALDEICNFKSEDERSAVINEWLGKYDQFEEEFLTFEVVVPEEGQDPENTLMWKFGNMIASLMGREGHEAFIWGSQKYALDVFSDPDKIRPHLNKFVDQI